MKKTDFIKRLFLAASVMLGSAHAGESGLSTQRFDATCSAMGMSWSKAEMLFKITGEISAAKVSVDGDPFSTHIEGDADKADKRLGLTWLLPMTYSIGTSLAEDDFEDTKRGVDFAMKREAPQWEFLFERPPTWRGAVSFKASKGETFVACRIGSAQKDSSEKKD